MANRKGVFIGAYVPNELKESKAIRDTKNERYDAAIHNRVNDRRCDVRIGIQQRTEIDDWTGGRLAQGCWELLKIRSRYRLPRPDENPITFAGWQDPRRTDHGTCMGAGLLEVAATVSGRDARPHGTGADDAES